MKKILMSAVAMIFAAGVVNAQSPWSLGGSVGFNFGKDSEKTKTTSFSINPEVGYMLNDNWGITLGLEYSMDKTKADGEDAVTNSSLFGVALGAIYKYQIVDKFFYAPTVKVGYSKENEGDKDSVIEANLNFLRFEYRPACHWGFSLGFGGLGYTNTKPKGGDAENKFGLNVLDQTTVGFTYYF